MCPLIFCTNFPELKRNFIKNEPKILAQIAQKLNVPNLDDFLK